MIGLDLFILGISFFRDLFCRSGARNEIQLQLQETRASDLHLDKVPFASGGWHGKIVLGRVKGHTTVTKLAPRNTGRGEVNFGFIVIVVIDLGSIESLKLIG